MCVCLFVTSRSSKNIKTVKQTELGFDIEATFGLSYIVLEGYSVISKNRGYFPLKHRPKL